MISVYSDVNSFKLFLFVTAYFYLSIGGGLQHIGIFGILGGNGGTSKAEDTIIYIYMLYILNIYIYIIYIICIWFLFCLV